MSAEQRRKERVDRELKELAVRAKETGEFGELGKKLYRLARAVAKGWKGSLPDRDEAVQESVISCWQALDRYEPMGSASAFFRLVIARCFRKLITAANAQMRSPELPVLDIDKIVHEIDVAEDRRIVASPKKTRRLPRRDPPGTGDAEDLSKGAA